MVAGLLPEPALRLTQAAQTGDAAEAARIDAAFQLFWSLIREVGSLRVMYALVDALSLGRFEPPRPILPLGPEVRTRLDSALDRIAALFPLAPAQGTS